MNPQYQIQDHTGHYKRNPDPKPVIKLEVKILTFLDGYHQEELEDTLKECLRKYGVSARISSSTGNEMTVNPPKLAKYGH